MGYEWTPDEEVSRLKWRSLNGGTPRAYGDFRDFADVGGKQEALKTTDPETARIVVAQRVAELQELRSQGRLGKRPEKTLGEYAPHHLRMKAEQEDITDKTMSYNEKCLERAIAYFGAGRSLASIQVTDLNRWLTWLKTEIEPRGGRDTASGRALNDHLHAISNLYRRAISEGILPVGHNPVSAMMSKPKTARSEADFLEADEAAALLLTARRYEPRGEAGTLGPGRIEAIMASLLLTGGRMGEVLGLLVKDVNFKRETVRFAPNRFRRLKTESSRRTIPLWPQLARILRGYLESDEAPEGELLLPSPRILLRDGEEGMITDLRKLYGGLAAELGWDPGRLESKLFRHTYCAARLQTLDRGFPVAKYTVSKEMGHGGFKMVERIYGHLGRIRHRSEVVEYPEKLGRQYLKRRGQVAA